MINFNKSGYNILKPVSYTHLKTLEPNIIIPMHYKTDDLDMDIAPLFGFMDAAGRYFDKSSSGASTLELVAGDKKKRSRIVILENKANC